MSNKQIVVVLGMHRSGTSAIARGLQALGVALGENLSPPAPSINDKGFWEDVDIVHLNDAILAELGCSWHSVRLVEPDELLGTRLSELRLRAAGLIGNRFEQTDCFGFKDPRTCRLLPFWQKVFSDLSLDDRYVIALRNPRSIVDSLTARDGISPEKSYLLWLGHMIPTMTGTEGKPRVVIDYDLLMDDPVRQMKRIAPVLGIKSDKVPGNELSSYADDFLEDNLRHTRFDLAAVAGDKRLPELALESYRKLLKLATDRASPKDPPARKAWHLMEKTLKALAPVYAYLDQEIQDRTETQQLVVRRDGEIANMHQGLADRDQQIISLTQGVIDRDSQIISLTQGVIDRDSQIISLTQGVIDRDSQIIGLHQAVATRDSQIIGLHQAVAARDTQISGLGQALNDHETHRQLQQITVETLQNELLGLLGSRPWRLIASLQNVSEWFGRTKRQKGRVDSAVPSVEVLLQPRDRRFVEFAYVTLLKRQPDPAGFHYYLGQLYAGLPKILILGQIVDSPEAVAKPIEVPGLRDAIRRHRSSRLNLVRRHVTGWIRRLLAGVPHIDSPGPALSEVLRHDDRRFVEAAYQALLKRSPDPADLHYYLGQLHAGMPKSVILSQILASPEAASGRK